MLRTFIIQDDGLVKVNNKKFILFSEFEKIILEDIFAKAEEIDPLVVGKDHCFIEYQYEELPYRSLKFDIITIDKEYYQKSVVTNYPNDYDFTRITEHKYFLDEKSNKTIISVEYPRAFSLGKNERYYPINNDKNDKLYNKYLRESKKLNNVYFFGRLGDYKYYNMDLAVERVLKLFKEIFKWF